LQVIGHKLAIEQGEIADTHTGNQPCQRDFGRIGGAGKHALAEKCTPHGKSVKPANKLSVRPAFNAVRHAHAMQLAKCRFNIAVDPGFLPVLRALRTGLDDRGKAGIRRHNETVLLYRFGERFRYMDAIQRQYRSGLGLYPKRIPVFT
jgi:hypothetical protein